MGGGKEERGLLGRGNGFVKESICCGEKKEEEENEEEKEVSDLKRFSAKIKKYIIVN